MKPLNPVALAQVEKRLLKLRPVTELATIRPGWIYYMRQALCMSLATLAKVSNLSKASVQQMEKREQRGKITLETLERLASAMECQLVYAFVPKKEIKTILWEKAIQKASHLVTKANVHMELEDQKVTENLKERIERIAKELVIKGDVW